MDCGDASPQGESPHIQMCEIRRTFLRSCGAALLIKSSRFCWVPSRNIFLLSAWPSGKSVLTPYWCPLSLHSNGGCHWYERGTEVGRGFSTSQAWGLRLDTPQAARCSGRREMLDMDREWGRVARSPAQEENQRSCEVLQLQAVSSFPAVLELWGVGLTSQMIKDS